MRVLVIEDDRVLGDAVREHVASFGYGVDWMKRIDDAREALATVPYDLVLLDLNLPDGRGLDLLRELRRGGSKVPVIILTAMDQIASRIEGLNSGADDYLVKPFDLCELVGPRHRGRPPLWRQSQSAAAPRRARHRSGAALHQRRRPAGGFDGARMGGAGAAGAQSQRDRSPSPRSRTRFMNSAPRSTAMRSRSMSAGCARSSAVTRSRPCAAPATRSAFDHAARDPPVFISITARLIFGLTLGTTVMWIGAATYSSYISYHELNEAFDRACSERRSACCRSPPTA